MATYEVDLTGIQPGDTIVCATVTPAITFEVGPPLVQSIAINYPTQDAGDLPASPADGSKVTVRVGTAPNRHQETLRWNNTLAKWIGEVETIIMAQGDSWAMDLGDRSGSEMLDWSPINNPVPYGKAFTTLDGSVDLSNAAFNNDGTPTGVITVADTTNADAHGSGPFASSSDGAYLRIRDNFITYTGKTSTTFTGCAVVQGSRGTIPDEEWVAQGYSGGWGFNTTSIPFADLMYAAGLELEVQIVSMMNSGPGEHKFTIGAYWEEYDPGDGTLPPALPLTGGLGVFPQLQSLDDTGGPNVSERSFYLTEPAEEWARWSLAAPSKRILVPRMVGKMASGATSTGQCLDTKLAYRWVFEP
jgi:hypothetical protein